MKYDFILNLLGFLTFSLALFLNIIYLPFDLVGIIKKSLLKKKGKFVKKNINPNYLVSCHDCGAVFVKDAILQKIIIITPDNEEKYQYFCPSHRKPYEKIEYWKKIGDNSIDKAYYTFAPFSYSISVEWLRVHESGKPYFRGYDFTLPEGYKLKHYSDNKYEIIVDDFIKMKNK